MKKPVLACLLFFTAQFSQADVISFSTDPFFFLDTKTSQGVSGLVAPPPIVRARQDKSLGFNGFDEGLGTLKSVTITFDSVLTNFASIAARTDFIVPNLSNPGRLSSATTVIGATVTFADVFATQVESSSQTRFCLDIADINVSCGGFGTIKEDFDFTLETTDNLDAFLLSNLTDDLFIADLRFDFRSTLTTCMRTSNRGIRGANCTAEGGGIWEGNATITYDFDPVSVPAPGSAGVAALFLLATGFAARQRRKLLCR